MFRRLSSSLSWNRKSKNTQDSLLMNAFKDELIKHDPTEAVFEQLNTMEDTSTNGDMFRAFVLEVAPKLTSAKLHQITKNLIAKTSAHDIKTFLARPSFAKSFLIYELVHHKQTAMQHLDLPLFKTAYTNALNTVATAVFSTVTNLWHQNKYANLGPLGDAVPEIFFFLFQPHPTSSFKDIDPFIAKYFIAELDEMRKNQEDKLMNDRREPLYRGGRKLLVALALRAHLANPEDKKISDVFNTALEAQNLTQEQFFEGATMNYIDETFRKILINESPKNESTWW